MFRVIFLVFAIVKCELKSNLTEAFGRAYYGETTDFWGILMAENKCLEAKWILNNYEHGLVEGLEEFSHLELVGNCDWNCDAGSCYTHYAHEFVNDNNCYRLISGDLSYQFEQEVINQPQSEERDSMMAVMNIMCGHIEFDCAYASAGIETGGTCQEQCYGQMWNEGHNNFVEPCGHDLVETDSYETDFWAMLFPIWDSTLKCLEAKWFLASWDYEVYFMEGIHHHYEMVSYCDSMCGGSGTCGGGYIQQSDFVHQGNCNRLISGDLSDQFLREVINAPPSEARDGMIATMNILCGNLEMDCAYAAVGVVKTEETRTCSDICHGQMRNEGHNNFVEPCNLWTLLFSTEDANIKCLEAKWILSNWDHGIMDDLEQTNRLDLVMHCEGMCGSGRCGGNVIQQSDFVHKGNCNRLISGDLSDQFEQEVINQPQSEERDSMMAVMNILCGNVELECAYAAKDHWEDVRGRNIFDEIADAIETEEKRACLEKCDGQMWNDGFNNFVEPCSSLMHSLSIAIILIISLIR